MLYALKAKKREWETENETLKNADGDATLAKRLYLKLLSYQII